MNSTVERIDNLKTTIKVIGNAIGGGLFLSGLIGLVYLFGALAELFNK